MGFSLDAQALRLQTLYFSKMIMETYNIVSLAAVFSIVTKRSSVTIRKMAARETTYNRDIQFIIDPGNKNKWILISFLIISIFWFGLAGGGARPSNRLIGMCRGMGWHFYDWIDYKGVAFSIELLEWGHPYTGFWG